MVHALASETSPAHHLPLAKRSPAPSNSAPLHQHQPRYRAASPPTISNRSIVSPGFPCISPQVPSSHPIISIKTKRPLKAIVGRCFKRLAALDNRQVRVSHIDTSPDEAPRDRVALEGTSSASGFYSLAFVRSLVSLWSQTFCSSFCFRSLLMPLVSPLPHKYNPPTFAGRGGDDSPFFCQNLVRPTAQTKNRARKPSRSSQPCVLAAVRPPRR